MHYRLEMPEAPAAARVLKASLDAVHATSGITTDRRRLSSLVSIPLRTLSAAVENCCKP